MHASLHGGCSNSVVVEVVVVVVVVVVEVVEVVEVVVAGPGVFWS